MDGRRAAKRHAEERATGAPGRLGNAASWAVVAVSLALLLLYVYEHKPRRMDDSVPVPRPASEVRIVEPDR